MIAAGSICVVFTTLARHPKDKITLCISGGENLFFWINSEPRRGGIGQIMLEAGDHGALTHRCYLDCSRVTTFLPSELEAAQLRGSVSPQLARRIASELQASPPKTLPGRYLKIALETMKVLAGD